MLVKSNYEAFFRRKGLEGETAKRMADATFFSPVWREKMIKPDPAICRLTTERFGLRPEESVFIDDSSVNLEAVRREGLHGTVFTSRQDADARLHAIMAQHSSD